MAKVFANAIVLEVLDKDNYIDWSKQVKTYLLAQDLWDMVEGNAKPKPPTIENDKAEWNAWTKKNASALHAIQMSCSRDAYHVIREIDSAKSAWDALSVKFKLQLRQEENKEKDSHATLFCTSYLSCSASTAGGFSHLQGKNSNAAGAESSTASTHDYEPFFNAVKRRELNTMKDFISKDREAVSARVQGSGETALHIAADAGNMLIVEELVRLMSEKDLEVQQDNGMTALSIAAVVGNTHMAKCMIEKNKRLLVIADMLGNIPICDAFNHNHMQLGRYLYSVTPQEVLLSGEGMYAVVIITQSIYNKNNIDIALDLLPKIPPSAIVKDWGHWGERKSPLLALASKPSAFYSGCRLMFWQRWIYHFVPIKPSSWTHDICISVQNLEDIQSTKKNIFGSVLSLLQQMAENFTQLLGIKHIYQMKWVHIHCNELLKLMCKMINSHCKQQASLISNANFHAIDRGIVEFVNGILKEMPDFVWELSDMGRNIFMHATQCRQVKIFNLIHGTHVKEAFLICHDHFGNNILHIAGMLAPYAQLNRKSGAALQMQRELQWFKEIEALVPPQCLEAVNWENKMTPRDLFTENHKNLVKEGEKWMKETATSCTVIGALIVTIMFTAAFTVPGGNDGDTGYPIFLQKKAFMVFIIADAMSLFSSTTSVLMFLGVLTTRYAEEDFLKSLPSKLILGLSTLFLSIATMMVSFSAALFIMLQTQSWILIPVILLPSIPISLFAWMQFPLLVEIFMSTYGTSIFEHKVDRWLYPYK